MCKINDVSIIIPSYNRPELLMEVLPSYLNQKYVHEIIIVDDGSTIPVQDILTTSKVIDERIHVIRHNRSMGLCGARNTGIFAARSPWIFFGEDDLILSENHIENLHAERIRLGADIICGNIIQQKSDESFEEACKQIASHKNLPVLDSRLISIIFGTIREPVELPFAHAIFLAPTQLLRKYQFSTRFGGPTFSHEEQELQLTLREAGFQLFATPNATGFHLSRIRGRNSGTRSSDSVLIHVASHVINSWQMINAHYETIAPFFGRISRKTMIRRILLWTIYIEIKRKMQLNYPAFNWLVCTLRQKLFLSKWIGQ